MFHVKLCFYGLGKYEMNVLEFMLTNEIRYLLC